MRYKKFNYCFVVFLLLLIFTSALVYSETQENCESLLSSNVYKYLLECKNLQVNKKYPVKDYIEYLPEILVLNEFTGAPHTVFKFKKSGKVEVLVKTKSYKGSWEIEGTKLAIETENYGKEYYNLTIFTLDFETEYNSYYCELLFDEPIEWAEETWGLSAHYFPDKSVFKK